jgi:hypothetical protein
MFSQDLDFLKTSEIRTALSVQQFADRIRICNVFLQNQGKISLKLPNILKFLSVTLFSSNLEHEFSDHQNSENHQPTTEILN